MEPKLQKHHSDVSYLFIYLFIYFATHSLHIKMRKKKDKIEQIIL